MIIGIDEVGLGSWAGPLVVCAFAAPDETWTVPGLNDSKKLSRSERTRIGKELLKLYAERQCLVWVDSIDIDKYGIKASLPYAMEKVLTNLISVVGLPDRVIIDGEDKGISGAEFYPKADGNYPCVMAASVLAKMRRDDHMISLAEDYPQYGFENHVGYGTKEHQDAITAHGLCPLHRRSYQPMRSYEEDL